MSDTELGNTGEAFGRPGMPPRWTSSSKEGVGTAYSVASQVWFTLSHGILNEVYYPTLDRPQIRDLQLLITDGETFFHEERRHLESTTRCLSRNALAYRIVVRDPEGRYELHKDVLSDPHQSCVLMRVKLIPAPEWEGKLHVYVLLAPHLGTGGADNTAWRFPLGDKTYLAATRAGAFLTLGVDTGFTRTSCGYVGTSDGWQDLHDNFRMDWEFERAEDGNVAMLGEVDLSKSHRFTVALAFGVSFHAAKTCLQQALTIRFATHSRRFLEQWHRVCCRIAPLDVASGDGGYLYRLSHKLLLAHEDKLYPGGFIASACIPWGQAKGDDDIGGYHLVWTRDMCHTVTALLACGDLVTPRRALVYLTCSQQPGGGFAQNFRLDGTPYWGGVQLDEVALPILLAWRLWKHEALEQGDPWPMVRAAAGFLVRNAPVTGQERWEENSGFSPGTLAVSIAALICAADFARAHRDEGLATFLEEYADFLESHVQKWTVTTAGGLLPEVPRHYIRVHPAGPADPSPDEDPNHGVLELRNQPPGAPRHYPARDIVDAGFLDLVRYGIVKPGDALIEDSLRVVDAVLKVDTPAGPCWRRYNHDGYGQRPDGGPFLGWGQGRAWPLLTGERGQYELAAGRSPRPHLEALEHFAEPTGMLSEQIWDEPDHPRHHRLRLGRPTGAAMPLMWAHAEYVRLLRSAADGHSCDRLPPVADRYLQDRGRKDLEVWQPSRQARSLTAGQVLRVIQEGEFVLHRSGDGGATWQDAAAAPTALGLGWVDLPTAPGQAAPLKFTFFYPAENRWEGRDYQVAVT